MIPVDMGEADYEDFEDMIEKLGVAKTVEALVAAKERLAKTIESLPEEERPGPMTVAEWREALQGEGEEEELDLLEGEEEEILEDDEADEDGADDAEEPATKKAKTD